MISKDKALQTNTDVLIIGAGAAGLMCAMEAGKRGRAVHVLEHARRPAEKIRISGGGRCNFTNLHTSPAHFISQNPRFCISALSRYTPADFITLVQKHGIAFHEKKLGQLFCDRSSQQIIDLLLAECHAAGATLSLNTQAENVSKDAEAFRVATPSASITAKSLVIATGGLSIPKMGATRFGYDIARQFGVNVVPTRPALVPFTLSEPDLDTWGDLSGVAATASVTCRRHNFRESILFTHRGLSGPAMLQISSYWNDGDSLQIDLSPSERLLDALLAARTTQPRQSPASFLNDRLPARLARRVLDRTSAALSFRPLAELSNENLQTLAAVVSNWRIVPNGTEGYRTAEVTRGGVDTADLSSKTMECRHVPGLYFIGEVVDVTGHLGGYNFQWAWASGYVAGQYV